MNNHMARVAPEKAVIRPVLPCVLSPGFTEKHMPREKGDRRAYWELLRDPQWQRKRLEVMERAEFRCDTCDADDKTLNVHHRIYRKNALPWEYADHELVCLCEDCHESEHHTRQMIDEALAKLGSLYYDDVLGYLHGFIFANLSGEDADRNQRVPIYSAEYASGLNLSMQLDLDHRLEPLLNPNVTLDQLRELASVARRARWAAWDEKLKRQ